MRGKKAKALRKLVYRDHDGAPTQYVGQPHRIPLEESPELNYERTTVIAAGHRRIYKDVKRELELGRLPR
jgi:hypothetical protein